MSLLTFSSPWLYAAAVVGGAAISATPESRQDSAPEAQQVSTPQTRRVHAPESREVPSYILELAQNEVRDGRVVSAYLDTEITSSPVYRVVMDASDWDRRLTIRGDGVVLHNKRMYESAVAHDARR